MRFVIALVLGLTLGSVFHKPVQQSTLSADVEDRRIHNVMEAPAPTVTETVTTGAHTLCIKVRLFGIAISGQDPIAVQDAAFAAQEAAVLAAGHELYRPGFDAASH